MRIHGICLVKNEADVFRSFVEASARWCDRICVFDNGSTDRTWELCKELARTTPQITIYRQDDRPFDDALRAEVFQQFRADAANGDWWCRLDADEFYIDDPRTFLAAVPETDHVVWSIHLQYYLTAADLPRFTPEDALTPPIIDASNFPRFYRADASEARFFRHRPRLEWTRGAWPIHVGLVTPARIRVKHFQYRSPAQILLRLETRRQAAARGWEHFGHSLESDWHAKIADPATLDLDRGDGAYVIDEHCLPRHLEPPFRRFAKRIMHGLRLWP